MRTQTMQKQAEHIIEHHYKAKQHKAKLSNAKQHIAMQSKGEVSEMKQGEAMQHIAM